MKQLLQKPLPLFLFVTLIVCTILFTMPINLFDGEVVFARNDVEVVRSIKLSLSYFIGLWIDQKDMLDVKTFYLTGTGYLLVGLMTVGFPALITYRVWLTQQNKKQQH